MQHTSSSVAKSLSSVSLHNIFKPSEDPIIPSITLHNTTCIFHDTSSAWSMFNKYNMAVSRSFGCSARLSNDKLRNISTPTLARNNNTMIRSRISNRLLLFIFERTVAVFLLANTLMVLTTLTNTACHQQHSLKVKRDSNEIDQRDISSYVSLIIPSVGTVSFSSSISTNW